MEFQRPNCLLEKAQVDASTPKSIKALQFGVPSSRDVVDQSVVEIYNRRLFDLKQDRAVVPKGPLDANMGTCIKTDICLTCGKLGLRCGGHFGHLKLALPVFHVGYFKQVINILWDICKECSSVLLPESDRRSFLKELRRSKLDSLRRSQIAKKIKEQCKSIRECGRCGVPNGKIKKVGPLKLVHEKLSAPKSDGECNSQDDLHPLRVFNILRRISPADCEILGMNPDEARPECFIWQVIPAPPVCIRPYVSQVTETGSIEDDLTVRLADIIQSNNALKQGLLTGFPLQKLIEYWEYLQLQVAVYISGVTPGTRKHELYTKPIRGFYQRLKGKEGRFRGNLLGKRVDFSGRTVISPDPNLRIDEVAIPEHIAKRITYREVVTKNNIKRLQQKVFNGQNKWPGASTVIKRGLDLRQLLKYGNRKAMAAGLQVGDIVERHMENGDLVLFNRQPSLHKLSVLCHYAKIHPHRTFCLNECVCHPYNADFDGDEMNIHLPQTEEARAEALELMTVKDNLMTPKNGKPIIGAIQDFIIAAYILSYKDTFLNRAEFAQICVQMLGPRTQFDLPPPAILKPQMLWTGKQVVNILMRPNKGDPVLVNLETACRYHKKPKAQPKDLDSNDAWLVIHNSEVMCGTIDKLIVGPGNKGSLFYTILREFGRTAAAEGMNRLSRLSAKWFANVGFSIGLTDVYPRASLTELKNDLMERAFTEHDSVIAKYASGKEAPGMDEFQNTENYLSRLLTKVRQEAGEECINQLSKHNPLLLMAMAGSKGSTINISQMTALVGQQIIGNQRIQDGFEGRTLPHFLRNTLNPLSKGFIHNSFFTGLSPTEFFFHAASGREGLLDTAVKTAETGYMSRRLIKSLEDVSCQYDNTIRTSTADIVQFQYGDDSIDPVEMEGRRCPVNFERTFLHAKATSDDPTSLSPLDIMQVCEEELFEVRPQLSRKDLQGNMLDYADCSDHAIDHLESGRTFLNSIVDFIKSKADKLASSSREVDSRIPNHVGRVPEAALRAFIQTSLEKYRKARLEPDHAVGAIGAQSIGEPGTQMTLNTFHFAGVSGMNLTQGVPRIKEIVNATVEISTPVITCELSNSEDLHAARFVKGLIERTYLRDILEYVKEMWELNKSYLTVKINWERVQSMYLNLNIQDIVQKIQEHRFFAKASDLRFSHTGSRIHIHMDMEPCSKYPLRKTDLERTTADPYLRLLHLKKILLGIQVSGYKQARHARIRADGPKHTLLVEGHGLQRCMGTNGVEASRTTTNSVMEMRSVLGIEAARFAIIEEISDVMKDLDIDPRHIQLLADAMTYKGEVLGITRFGLAKTRDSVLQLASFEQSTEHLFQAGGAGRVDPIQGVSECIIMGKPVRLGTGALGVVQRMQFRDGEIGKRKTVFEDSWD